MEEMSEAQVGALLGASGFGVLALASEGDAYAIPIYYGRDEEKFYFHSRHGIKDDFIEGTKLACLVVTKVKTPEEWRSVQVFGRIEKLAGAKATRAAVDILSRVPLPPEWQIPEKDTPSRSGRATFVWCLVANKMAGRKSRPSLD